MIGGRCIWLKSQIETFAFRTLSSDQWKSIKASDRSGIPFKEIDMHICTRFVYYKKGGFWSTLLTTFLWAANFVSFGYFSTRYTNCERLYSESSFSLSSWNILTLWLRLFVVNKATLDNNWVHKIKLTDSTERRSISHHVSSACWFG